MTQITDKTLSNMAAGSKPITDSAVKGLRFEPGKSRGYGKWIFRFTSPVTGKRRDLGLGTFPLVRLADARKQGLQAREAVKAGRDPIIDGENARARLKSEKLALTFEEAAREVHKRDLPGWRNGKHTKQWLTSLENHVFPKIGAMPVKGLRPADFADVLRPIWLEKPETAGRLKQRCHAVMEWCLTSEHVETNPVDRVAGLLPKQPSKQDRVQHQPAMPWRDLPVFVRDHLRAGDSNVSRATLEFIILTCLRFSVAQGMTWDEVDLDKKIWTIPATRMKAKKLHRVPLSTRAMAILERQRQLHPDATLVFPAPRGGQISDMTLTSFLRKHRANSSDPGRTATTHGFRSTFRDWASENAYSRDLAERALAHPVNNQVEAAYHRTDLLEQRRPMMEDWAAFVGSAST